MGCIRNGPSSTLRATVGISTRCTCWGRRGTEPRYAEVVARVSVMKYLTLVLTFMAACEGSAVTTVSDATPAVTPFPLRALVRIANAPQAGIGPGTTLQLEAVLVDPATGEESSVPAQWSTLGVSRGEITSTGNFTSAEPGVAVVVADFRGIADTVEIPIIPILQQQELIPAELKPTVGPIIWNRGTHYAMLGGLDARYRDAELSTYEKQFRVQLPATTGTDANHYGALRSRLQWAIRHGLPWGPGAEDPTRHDYGRGRAILMHYLLNYAKPNQHAMQPHNNTALADIEALWWLERIPEARDHIWVTAQGVTSRDGAGRFDMSNRGDPRQIAVALQALNAAHRMGIPFSRSPAAAASRGFNGLSVDSWRSAGDTLIASVLRGGNVHPDGTVNSPGHAGQCGAAQVCEAYFMSAMWATELLRWHGFIAPHDAAFANARSIMDHLVSELAIKGGDCLPYVSSQTDCAHDLAAFYVWPSLVLWQETADPKYHAFALKNLAAAEHAWVDGIKQFNQVYSTGAQSAQALLGGIAWR